MNFAITFLGNEKKKVEKVILVSFCEQDAKFASTYSPACYSFHGYSLLLLPAIHIKPSISHKFPLYI